MKKIFLMIAICSLLSSCEPPVEKMYCGKIKEKYHLPPDHHNNRPLDEYYVVFFSDSLQKYIKVKTTENAYYSSNVGELTCYSLSDYQLPK